MHGPNTVEDEDSLVVARRTAIGLRLLAVYSLCYAAFILICAFFVNQLSTWEWLAIPMSIWFGMGLMLGAIILAFLYGRLCR
jgi:uncharacterized membrane protein (DUF485 family)